MSIDLGDVLQGVGSVLWPEVISQPGSGAGFVGPGAQLDPGGGAGTGPVAGPVTSLPREVHYHTRHGVRSAYPGPRHRRRRKRLATASDLKDLAALKSILPPGEFKTWIATRGR